MGVPQFLQKAASSSFLFPHRGQYAIGILSKKNITFPTFYHFLRWFLTLLKAILMFIEKRLQIPRQHRIVAVDIQHFKLNGQ